ncbi:MAG TPA: TIR domain-containing protein [Sphingomicrobium sp.]|nr:TIR domain-containing protein [Sphingomicrobium sp.]
MADVFISYKREDAAKVRRLVAALRASGLDTWWDEDIPPSAPWEATIEKELARAKVVIVCWSPDAVASDNVRSEARVAREDGRLIQLFMKPCQPPLFFGEQQGLDLSKWRGNSDDPRIPRLTESARKVAAGERMGDGERPKARKGFDVRLAALAAALLLLIAGGFGWWWLSPAKASGPTTLAVLPFRALNPADANLVDAIWDDTRGAIGRNPNLRVIGRNALESLADKHLDPRGYRRKLAADYLLNGSVEHVGDQVQIKLSLVRTEDAAEVWSDRVGGRLDDVFAFQQRIAQEVEGRIRGRVAPGGGTTAQNIATSGEVYALYADARALFRKRDSESAHAAIALLKKAVALDPNYAPAWALLGQITGMGLTRTADTGPAQQEREAVAYLNRALQLAPNLAHAHAALAMVQNFAPQLDGELRKAVELDPNDVEAWGWLANSLQNQNRLREALAARNRAAEIEPLWYWTVSNKIGTMSLLEDWTGIDAELKRVAAVGDPVLLAKAQIMAAAMSRRPGDEMRILLELRAAHPEEAAWVDNRIFDPAMALGFVDEAAAAWHIPPWATQDYRGEPLSANVIRRELPAPLDIWTDGDDAIALYGRLLPRRGRLNEYIGYYDAAFKSPSDLFALWENRPGLFVDTAPTLASDLRLAGRNEEADAILRHAEQVIEAGLKNGPPTFGDSVALGYLRAARGRDDEAMALLNKAASGGWIPDRRWQASDIADEPCFAHLVNRADFQAIRRRILARIEQERRKVPLDLLAEAYPVRRQAAA